MKQLKIADRYTIKELIHESNMSLVYLAFDENLKREVIIKKIKAEKPTLEMKNRFKREIEILVELDHSGIVPIYECSYNGEIFYVMKYIKGKSLKELLPNISIESKLVIFRQVLEIISFIHKKKILHRDIKPDNILITENFTPVLIDFGFAIGYRYNADHEEVVGTIQYCSPEQTGIVKRPVDRRSDLYSLGIALYECSTGAPPFQTNDVGKMIQLHATQKPKTISEIIPGFSIPLQNVILKLIAKDPDDRYQSAEDALKDLIKIQSKNIEDDLYEEEEIDFVGKQHELKLLISSRDGADRRRGSHRLKGSDEDRRSHVPCRRGRRDDRRRDQRRGRRCRGGW
jgi:serine/threonine protein kinase